MARDLVAATPNTIDVTALRSLLEAINVQLRDPDLAAEEAGGFITLEGVTITRSEVAALRDTAVRELQNLETRNPAGSLHLE
jgi:hypothetical protein